ncbi:MAG TPA: CopD family protein [Flavobacteriales bacterium]|nr:CopD family protein [Flavobacteriales bacterium]
MLPSWYPALVAVHIIAMATFFTGTFVVLRGFVLHRKALSKPEPLRTTLALEHVSAGSVPLYMVAWPSLLLLIITGAWMIGLRPDLLAEAWVQAKLGLMALLFAYHLVNQRIYRKMQADGTGWGLFTLRIWAQGALLMMIVAVFLSTFRQVDWYIGVLGLVVLAVLLFAGVRGMGSRDDGPDAAEGQQPPTAA